MNVKTGTQTWSTAKADAKLGSESTQPSALQTLSAKDRDAVLGDKNENIGDVLNHVADPNWVDPAKARKVGNNQLDKDAFLKLMLTQMKYQDPTNPMQSHEMAAQLAQFTSLEQLNNINTTLTGMKQAQSPVVNYQALNFIGKVVSGDSSKVTRATGDTDSEFRYTLPNDAGAVSVKVVDGEGNVVKGFDLGPQKKGENSMKWNGLDNDGQPVRPGEYRFMTEAQASNGSRMFVKTEFNGRITGLNYTAAGPVLLVGQQSIRMSDVKRIEEGPSTPGLGAGAGTAPGQITGQVSGQTIGSSNGTASLGGLQGQLPPQMQAQLAQQAMAQLQGQQMAAAAAPASAGMAQQPAAQTSAQAFGQAIAPTEAVESAPSFLKAVGKSETKATVPSQQKAKAAGAGQPGAPAKGDMNKEVAMSRKVMEQLNSAQNPEGEHVN